MEPTACRVGASSEQPWYAETHVQEDVLLSRQRVVRRRHLGHFSQERVDWSRLPDLVGNVQNEQAYVLLLPVHTFM